MFDRLQTSVSAEMPESHARGVCRNKTASFSSGPVMHVVAYAVMMVVLMMTLLAFPGGVFADDAAPGEVDSGGEAIQAGTNNVKVADPDSRYTFEEMLGDTDSTRYAGRVWTDKSVSTTDVEFTNNEDNNTESVEIGDSDFLVTYSALATSQQITQLPRVPVDVVFILDLSGSMNWAVNAEQVDADNSADALAESRFKAMVDSLNNSISMLVEDNPDNRIAIVTFNATASTLLPLTDAKTIAQKVGDEQYLEITDFKLDEKPQDPDEKQEATATVTCKINDKTAATSGGTNIEAGLYEGMTLLSCLSKDDTTFVYGNKCYTRVPNVVLMTDGAPTTFSSASDSSWIDSNKVKQEGTLTKSSKIKDNQTVESGSWWNKLDPSKSIGGGDIDNAHSADGFMAILMAAYQKEAITQRYSGNAVAVGAPNKDQANCHVYTIGFSTNYQTESMVAMANMVLNPDENAEDDIEVGNNYPIRELENAWQAYLRNEDVIVYGQLGASSNINKYNVEIDEKVAIPSLAYPDKYFYADDAGALNDVFRQITNAITESASAPTKVGSGSLETDGYITYSDPIGEYMKVDGIKALIYAGETFTVSAGEPVKNEDGSITTIYSAKGTITSPVYGERDASLIEMKVVETADGKQTLTVRVPAAAIPLRVNEVEINADGTVESNNHNAAYPMRVVYGVSLRAGVLNEDGTVNTEDGSLSGLSEYVEYNKNSDGSINFYSNLYTGATEEDPGDATVTFEPADSNPFYFVQEDTPLYTGTLAADGSLQNMAPATGELDVNQTYYFNITFYEGLSTQTVWIARSGAMLSGYTGNDGEGNLYFKSGSPRIGNLATFAKAGENTTNTAQNRFQATFVGTNPHDGQFVVYLGNNGCLTVQNRTKDVFSTDEDGNKTGTSIDGQAVGVGDVLTYTVDWSNDTGADAMVTVRDTVPQGTAYVEGSAEPSDDSLSVEPGAEGGDIVWNLGPQPAGASGTVTFQVTVEDSAVDNDGNLVSNQATVQVGEDGPQIATNTVTNTVFEKHVYQNVESGGTDAASDADGQAVGVGDVLTYTVDWSNDTGAEADVTVRDTVPQGTAYVEGSAEPSDDSLSVEPGAEGGDIVWNLGPQPAGASGTVTFQVTVEDSAVDNDGNLVSNQATVQVGENGPQIATNTVTNTVSGEHVYIAVKKIFTGRSWTSNDVFKFTLSPTSNDADIETDDMPMPESETISIGAPAEGASDPTTNTASFGAITFNVAGEYHYVITEASGVDDGITYGNPVEVTVSVTDENNDGKLEAEVTYDGNPDKTVDAATFVNSYDATGTLGGEGNVSIEATKTLNGRPMREGEFSFIVTDASGEVATGTNEAASAGAPGKVTFGAISYTRQGLMAEVAKGTAGFSVVDGKDTFTKEYTVSEGVLNTSGVTAEVSSFDITVRLTDNGDGTLTPSVSYPEGTDSLAFVNVYGGGDEGSATVDFAGVKAIDVASGADASQAPTLADIEGKYTFTLTGSEGAPLPEVTEVTNAADGSVSFGSLTYTMDDLEGAEFDEQGCRTETFTYAVSESLTSESDRVDGVYNGGPATFTVTLTDCGDGELNVTTGQVEGAPLFTITNTYSPEPAVLGADGKTGISGCKILNGRVLQEGEFTFLLTGGDDITTTAIADGTVKLAVPSTTNKADGTFSFGKITFGAVGTYTFNVAELIPRGADETGTFNGVTYDRTVIPVTVVVTDDGKGQLNASVQNDPVIEFVNTFAPQGQTATVVPAVTKTLTGSALSNGQFSFRVTDASEQTVSVGVVKVDAAGTSTVDMTPIVYDADSMDGATENGDGSLTKVFTYIVSEVNDGKAGVSYDLSEYLMTVVVTVDANGDFAEPQTSYALVTADGNQPTEGAAFTNHYAANSPATYTPQGTKTTIKQEDVDLGDMSFSFEVLDAQGARVAGGTAPANGPINFEDIELPMAAGVYHYTVKELKTVVEGLTFDTTTYDLAITVVDNGAGSYVVTNVAYTNTATNEVCNSANFTNVYNGGVVSLNLGATKVLNAPNSDRTLKAGEFGFTVYDEDGEIVATATNDADGNVDFGSLYYSYNIEQVVEEPSEGSVESDGTEASQPVEEQPGEVEQVGEAGQPEEVDQGEASGEETGTVEETEPIETTEPSVDEQPVEPTAPVEPAAPTEPSEVIEPEAPAASEDSAVDAGPVVTDEPAVDAENASGAEGQEVSVDPVAGIADFLTPEVAVADDANTEPYTVDALVETAPVTEEATVTAHVVSADLGMHRYTIVENQGNLGGITYDKAKYLVDVEVKDNKAEGTIEANVVAITRIESDGVTQTPVALAGDDGMDNVVFSNTYQVTEPATVSFEGTKVLEGRDMAAGEFGFEVYGADGSVVAMGLNTAAPAGEAAAIDFGAVEVKAAGTYTYTVQEVNAGKIINGVTYSTQKFTVVVKATDNGKGGLDIAVEYPDGPVSFTNEYAVTTAVIVGFEGTKVLEGRDMAAGEFGFEVRDADGELVAGGQNAAAADGEAAAIELGKVTIAEPGEYDYAISEVPGSAGGVTYDGAVFTAHVSVVDNLDGTMSATVSYPDGPVAFTNVYGTVEGASAAVTPEATKTLTGRDMKDGEFSFVVTDKATGGVVSRGTNAADGTVSFDAIELTAKGNYEFQITEVNGRQDGMTYDDAAFRMLVAVGDDGEGGLTAEVSYPDGTPAFANSYKELVKPSDPGTTGQGGEPDGQVPKTGDATDLAGAAALGLGGLGAALVGGGALLGRRSSR